MIFPMANDGEPSWSTKMANFMPTPNDFPFDAGGTMFDMTETGEPPATTIIDEVNAYTMSEIYNAMLPPVVSVQIFQPTVLFLNGNKQQITMNMLFNSYGF
ncbi:MAG: hypothetical protein KG003_13675 [Bacteroidetes bacterium]|nr:hypothetical protein [Bacteroidota bacterium]